MNKEQIREAVRHAIIEVQALGPPMHATTLGMLATAAANRAADAIFVACAESNERIGQAPKCHQDPARDSAWCAVHDECPDWHSEVTGYRGPAGFVCNAGGMALDARTGAAALRAHNAASEACNSECERLRAQIEETASVREQDQRRRDELDRYPGSGAG